MESQSDQLFKNNKKGQKDQDEIDPLIEPMINNPQSHDFSNLKNIDGKLPKKQNNSENQSELISEKDNHHVRFESNDHQSVLNCSDPQTHFNKQPRKSILKRKEKQNKFLEIEQEQLQHEQKIDSEKDLFFNKNRDQILKEVEQNIKCQNFTMHQFMMVWHKFINKSEDAFQFLKIIQAKNFVEIFKEGIDIVLLNHLFQIFKDQPEEEFENVKKFVLKIQQVSRFNILLNSLQEQEKEDIRVVLLKLQGKIQREDILLYTQFIEL